MKNNNIILMGFMGVGKGSLARELAKKTKRIAVDTDDLIESIENRKIKKIFEQEGEPYFREREKKISRWLKKSVRDTIISIGGGFYQVGNLQKIGHVIYLESSFDAILDRISSFDNAKSKLKKRPLLQDMKKAKKPDKRTSSQIPRICRHGDTHSRKRLCHYSRRDHRALKAFRHLNTS
jgi:shikimate kinase